jgi:hypothetical protein
VHLVTKSTFIGVPNRCVGAQGLASLSGTSDANLHAVVH